MTMSNKELVKKAQSILTALGYTISLGHVYELFSKLSGSNNWNVASAQKTQFSDLIAKVMDINRRSDTINAVPEDHGSSVFIVKVIVGGGDEAELRKFYRISAKNEAEAKSIVKEYVNVREGETSEDKIKHEQTKLLMRVEDEDEYKWQNWEIISMPFYMPSVTDVYEDKPKKVNT